MNSQSMNPRGRRISRAASIVVIACLAAGLIAANANSGQQQVAAKSKKCKRKHHKKKRRCKRHSPAPAMISISPTSQDFGVPQIGGETRTFTVTNVGGSPSGAPIPTLSQSGDDFSIAANGCTAPVSTGASCPIDIRVSTSGAGQVSAMLTVVAVPGGTASASMVADIEA
jgi:hypothetical protein